MHELINKETNLQETSLINNEKSTNTVRKHKNRSVKSIKKSKDRQIKKISTNTSIDKKPFPFGLCRVCTDKATGLHYGVSTCEGCKGFFKRSILRKEKYRCYFGDQCVINSDNRNRCKSCRFKKCVDEGMSVESVRMGRIPKLVKEKALAEHTLSSIENEDPKELSSSHMETTNSIVDLQLPLTNEQFFVPKIDSLHVDNLFDCHAQQYLLKTKTSSNNFNLDQIKQDDKRIVKLNRLALTNYMTDCEERFNKNVIQRMKNISKKISHPTTFQELDHEESSFIRHIRWKMFDVSNTYNGRTKQLVERMNTMIQLGLNDFPGNSSTVQDIWEGLTDAIPLHVKNLIAFAREIPAVNEIETDDFHKIMNNRLFDLWLIKHTPLIRNNESYMMLPNGLQYTRQWMNEIIGEEMVQTMFEFANKFNALNLTNEEHALIFPVVICVNDDTLNDQESVRAIQYCYLYALYIQMLITRTPLQAKALFYSFLQICGYLPLLNELQEKKIGPLIPPNIGNES